MAAASEWLKACHHPLPHLTGQHQDHRQPLASNDIDIEAA